MPGAAAARACAGIDGWMVGGDCRGPIGPTDHALGTRRGRVGRSAGRTYRRAARGSKGSNVARSEAAISCFELSQNGANVACQKSPRLAVYQEAEHTNWRALSGNKNPSAERFIYPGGTTAHTHGTRRATGAPVTQHPVFRTMYQVRSAATSLPVALHHLPRLKGEDLSHRLCARNRLLLLLIPQLTTNSGKRLL